MIKFNKGHLKGYPNYYHKFAIEIVAEQRRLIVTVNRTYYEVILGGK